jgi:hypothetical protein
MSAVLVAVFSDHSTAERLRTLLVKDGFPTDRVELTSSQELGQAKLVPRDTVGEKLAEYFRTLFQHAGIHGDERAVQLFSRAVVDGKAALAVHPRGDIETDRALAILNQGGPLELREADLESQTFEHAAAHEETELTWIGKVLAGPGAPDTTGTARLP